MDFLLRCLVLSLAAFAMTHLVVSLAVAAMWRYRGPGPGTSTERANALLHLRLIPTVAALAMWVFAASGLYRFESRDADEIVGRVIWLCAGAGAVLLLVTCVRLARMAADTRRLLHTWLAEAQPVSLPGISVRAFRITTGFPVVAVVGVIRPRLVIDAQVLDACSAEELHAILAHERGHLHRWDNLRRVLFAAVPGPWGVPDLPAAWRDATEEAADDIAAQTGQQVRFHLASALLRVARLAPAARCRWSAQLPASALYRGDDVERRIRRLVASTPTGVAPRVRWPWAVAVTTASAGVALGLQRELHDIMERVVAFLP